MFKNAKLKINEQTVEYEDAYAERAYIENLVNFPKDVKTTTLTSVGWMQDKARSKDFGTADADAKNARRVLLAGSREVEFSFRPKLSLFSQEKMLPPDQRISLEFQRNSVKYCLMHVDGTPFTGGDPILEITKMVFKVRRVDLFDDVRQALEQVHSTPKPAPVGPVGVDYKYAYKRVTTYRRVIGSGRTEEEITLTQGRRQTRVLFALVDQGGASGDFTKCPFNYATNGVNFVRLSFDGENIDTPYEPNYTTDKFAITYAGCARALGHWNGLTSNCVTPDSFKSGSAVYAWDTSRQLQDDTELVSNTTVSIKVQFSTATTTTLTALVLQEVDEMMTINALNQVELL